jgi:hypothetical protein
MYIQRYIVELTIVTETQQYISFFIVVGVNFSVRSINVISFSMETTAQVRGRWRALVNAVMNLRVQ